MQTVARVLQTLLGCSNGCYGVENGCYGVEMVAMELKWLLGWQCC